MLRLPLALPIKRPLGANKCILRNNCCRTILLKSSMTTQRLCPCEQRDAVASSIHKHNAETAVTEDNDDRSGGGYPRPASNICSGKRDGGRDIQAALRHRRLYWRGTQDGLCWTWSRVVISRVRRHSGWRQQQCKTRLMCTHGVHKEWCLRQVQIEGEAARHNLNCMKGVGVRANTRRSCRDCVIVQSMPNKALSTPCQNGVIESEVVNILLYCQN